MIEQTLKSIADSLAEIQKSNAAILEAMGTPAKAAPVATAPVEPEPDPAPEPEVVKKKRASKKVPTKGSASQPAYANVGEFTKAAVELVTSYEPDDKDGQLVKLKAFIASKGYKTGIREVPAENYHLFMDDLKSHMDGATSESDDTDDSGTDDDDEYNL